MKDTIPRETVEKALMDLTEMVPCCSCCGSDDGYTDAVREAAETLGYKVNWFGREAGRIEPVE